MKIQKVFKPVTEFEEIDITKALTTSGRVFYPKIGKKTRIDDFLARRTHLKLLEERRLSQSEKLKEMANKITAPKNNEDDAEIDIESTEDNETSGGNATLQNILSGKQVLKVAGSKDVLSTLGKRIQQVRAQYANITRLGGKTLACYSRYCNLASQNVTNKTVITAQSLVTNCYSPICLKKIQLKRDLVILLRKANTLNNPSTANAISAANAVISGQSTPIKTERTEDSKDKIIKSEPGTTTVAPETSGTEEKKMDHTQNKTKPRDGSGDVPEIKKMKLEPV